jgi:hypothetical protein
MLELPVARRPNSQRGHRLVKLTRLRPRLAGQLFPRHLNFIKAKLGDH